jgi:hypothetical protein
MNRGCRNERINNKSIEVKGGSGYQNDIQVRGLRGGILVDNRVPASSKIPTVNYLLRCI